MTTFDLRREVNEQIYALLTESSVPSRPSDRMDALCECDGPCQNTITLKVRVYARVRSRPGWRLALPEHDCGGEEICRTAAFKIVRAGSARHGATVKPPCSFGCRSERKL